MAVGGRTEPSWDASSTSLATERPALARPPRPTGYPQWKKTIRSHFGQDVIVVFLNGACGDVTQVDNIGMRKNRSDEWLDILGTRVGSEAVKTLVSSERTSSLEPVAARQEKLTVKRRRPDSGKTKKAATVVSEGIADPANHRKSDWTWAKERLIADYIIAKNPERTFEVQAIQIGPAVFLANPSEYFCASGLEIKKGAANFPYPFVVELANDIIGYVPDGEAFASGGGGYETRLTSYSNLDPNTGSLIIKKCVEMANSLEAGKAPVGPSVDKPGSPWVYGDNPPELC